MHELETRPREQPDTVSRPSSLRIAGGLRRLDQRLAKLFGENQQKNSIAVLDGVRALACLLVISFHISLMTSDQKIWDPLALPIMGAIGTAGGSGVTLFFVLSGFLLFLPYAKALLFKGPLPQARLFYMRRAFRIIPGYYVSLFLIILLFQPQYLQVNHLRELLLFMSFFMDSTPETFRQLNGPYWTLAVEWQFYLLLPLLAAGLYLLAWRIPQRWRLRAVLCELVGVIAWALFLRYWGFYFLSHPGQTFLVPRAVLNVALFFLHGMDGKFLEDFTVGMLISVCYVFAQRAPAGSGFTQRLARWSPWLLAGGILMLLFMALWHFNHDSHGIALLNALLPAYDVLSELGFALGYGACVAALLFGSHYLRRPFEWRYLRWIGLISYSLYVWHLVLLVLFKAYIQHFLPALNGVVAYSSYWLFLLLVVLPCATLSYALVEKPWMRVGDLLRRPRST
ncbi:MAG: acyltransferase [Chloroflexota bacterium]|nr:acyltransferase [Chloroflexota bacterium]